MDTLEYTYGHDIVAQELENLVIFVRYNNGIGFAVIKPGLKTSRPTKHLSRSYFRISMMLDVTVFYSVVSFSCYYAIQ